MPKASKRKRKGRRSERLVWKLGGRVAVWALRGRSPDAVLRAAWDRYLTEGEETPGVHLIGSWRNPDNQNPRHSNWKTSDDESQSLEGFFATILQRVGATSAAGTRFSGASAEQVKALDKAFRKRSEAAKKGWERRKRLAAKRAEVASANQRSQAARKGWKTRQAKQAGTAATKGKKRGGTKK